MPINPCGFSDGNQPAPSVVGSAAALFRPPGGGMLDSKVVFPVQEPPPKALSFPRNPTKSGPYDRYFMGLPGVMQKKT